MKATVSTSFTRPLEGHPNGVQLGGLGTGRLELGRNGRITLAGITNNWQRLLAGLEGSFFSLRTENERGSTFHLLQSDQLEGFPGCGIDYKGTHPFAKVGYSLDDSPLEVELRAFAPLVPHDLANSNIPGVVFRFVIRNSGNVPVHYQLGCALENFLGCGSGGRRGLELRCNRTGNTIEPWRDGRLAGLLYTGGEFGPPNASGEMLLATPESTEARAFALQSWNVLLDRSQVIEALSRGEAPARFDGGDIDSLMAAAQLKRDNPPSWDDPDPRFGGGRTGIEGSVHPAGILGLEGTIAPGGHVEPVFYLGWFTPHHFCLNQPGLDHGHAYANRFQGAAEVVRSLAQNEGPLRDRTHALQYFLESSTLPHWLVAKMLNDHTAITTNSILTAEEEPYVLEASPMMFGALGTLDQRLVSHPGMSLFYPELNRRELRSFARLQAADGSLPHFNGNAYTAMGSTDVEYGSTGWPDLSCSFIIQIYRDWIDSGDVAFIEEMLPAIRRAAAFLMAADRDGDGVPEGGSSWDIEHYSGCFIATATVWMAALRILTRIGEYFQVETTDFDRCFEKAASTVDGMWTGSYYLKYKDPTTGQESDDVFLGQLAGEWVVRQLGLPSILPENRVRKALETIYRLNGNRDRYRLMPIQVQPDGSLADRKYAWHAWPQYSLVFVDCLALHVGLTEPAMRNIRAFDQVVCERNCTPWATTLWHDARTGEPDFDSFMGLDWYMNTPASWWMLSAVVNYGLNLADATLDICPESLADGACLPVITPRCWAMLERSDGGIRFRVERLFGIEALRIERYCLRSYQENLTRAKLIELPEPRLLREGDVFVPDL